MNVYQRAVALSSEESLEARKTELAQEEQIRILNGERKAEEFQHWIDWLQSSCSQKLFSELNEKINSLLSEVMSLTESTPQNNNEKLIVAKLSEANVLRKVVEKYANTKKS